MQGKLEPFQPRKCKCGKLFVPERANQEYCRRSCKSKNTPPPASKLNRVEYRDALPSGTVGAISELAVAVYLAKYGWDVFRAISPNCYCDLIISRGTLMLRLEVRTGLRNIDGKLTFPTNIHGDIDFFAIYIPEHNQVVFYSPDLQEVEIK